MNFIKKPLAIILLLFSFSSQLHAVDKDVSRGDAFIFLAEHVQTNVPESFQYIELNYTGIEKDSKLEDSLQILIYLDLIKNRSSYFSPQRRMNLGEFEQLAQVILDISVSERDVHKATRYIKQSDLNSIRELLLNRNKVTTPKKTITIGAGISTPSSDVLGKKGKLLEDVYKTLSASHYNRDDFEDNQLIDSAIKGLADGSGDRFTKYFPAVESNDFFEALDGEYEGIGAYVDMPEPGVFIIVSPISGSPSEKAGLKGGDQVTHVNEKEITINTSMKEIISWIKGPAGTTVKLTIKRKGDVNPLTIKVKREKIVIKDVEFEKLKHDTFYLQIKGFGENVSTHFNEAVQEIKKDSNIKKIIIDLRNNPGGYLGEVSLILSHFVEKGEPTAVVNSGTHESVYKSVGYQEVDFSKYKIIFLQNSGTASASEIMIGTIKDYFPNSIIIGEQSFGKGSVQSLKRYYDGSTLKYTTAKWFTGKTKQGIDGVGVTPDIELEFDSKRWETYKKDNQLEKALKK